jgi:hypothetical protein
VPNQQIDSQFEVSPEDKVKSRAWRFQVNRAPSYLNYQRWRIDNKSSGLPKPRLFPFETPFERLGSWDTQNLFRNKNNRNCKMQLSFDFDINADEAKSQVVDKDVTWSWASKWSFLLHFPLLLRGKRRTMSTQ